MGILGLLTIALVAGTIARTLYADAVPADVVPSLLLGLAGVIAGFTFNAVTGVGEMTSAASPKSWLTAVTSACLLAILADALRAAAKPRRTVGRAS